MRDATPDPMTGLHRTPGLDGPADGHRRLRVWPIGAVLLGPAMSQPTFDCETLVRSP